ncbi:hypothetical protein ACHHV8_13990 [Paenibacillus sp. TAB 01]
MNNYYPSEYEGHACTGVPLHLKEFGGFMTDRINIFQRSPSAAKK